MRTLGMLKQRRDVRREEGRNKGRCGWGESQSDDGEGRPVADLFQPSVRDRLLCSPTDVLFSSSALFVEGVGTMTRRDLRRGAIEKEADALRRVEWGGLKLDRGFLLVAVSSKSASFSRKREKKYIARKLLV